MRLFYCQYCGHHLRFGPPVCSACSMPTSAVNRYRFWARALIAFALGSVAILSTMVF
ncbi:hypothetical protein GGR30_002093 [Martelella radicis]|uniref:Uncharacterized protein n=1 Tax=Martelella radicis TaxID=1397476 RepID=A0A7W6KL70_9HYPH|nr:hypothetical protein [Martelella radicis]